MVNSLYKKKSPKLLCAERIAIYLVHCKLFSQIVCSVLNKWHFHFYLSAHRDFGFFLFRLFTIKTSYRKHKTSVLGFGLKQHSPCSPRMTIKHEKWPKCWKSFDKLLEMLVFCDFRQILLLSLDNLAIF